MTSNTIVATKKFTIDLTKAELDSIHKQFLEELEEMLDRVRTTTRKEAKEERKSYRYDNERDNVTVTLCSINNNNNNLINSNNKNRVIVTVTLTCLLSLRYLF